MPASRPYRKFSPQQEKISRLEEKSSRFRRIYSEYETMSDNLWALETSNAPGIPDDFLDSIKMQTGFLEDEIEDWLSAEE